jgi:transmembrane sensor
VAAVLLLLIAGNWWLQQRASRLETVTADIAVKDILLDDGSHVYLRKGSVLRYPRHFEAKKRRVELTGEAFFDIAKNPAKPFEITASSTTVTVLGTSFLVNTNNSGVEVMVKTGRVRFAPVQDTAAGATLEPGEKALYENNRVTKQKNTDINFNSWQTGKIDFINTPMQEVIHTLSSHYRVSINIRKEDEKAIAASRVTTSYSNQPLDAVLKELELITAFHILKLADDAYEIRTQ